MSEFVLYFKIKKGNFNVLHVSLIYLFYNFYFKNYAIFF